VLSGRILEALSSLRASNERPKITPVDDRCDRELQTPAIPKWKTKVGKVPHSRHRTILGEWLLQSRHLRRGWCHTNSAIGRFRLLEGTWNLV